MNVRGTEYCNDCPVCPSKYEVAGCLGELKVAPGAHELECVAMTDSYSSKLANLVLPDVDGKKVQLGSLWANHPVVLVFLRHWG